MHMISLKNRGFCSGNWIDDVWWLFQGFSSFIYGVICFPLQWLTTGCKNITQFMRIPVFSLALLCVCAKKKKISDVTVMQFCQVPVFNFYSVGHRCFLSISSPLSNVGSRRWILNLSGWDPGTHTHTKKRKKLFTFMSRNKETRNKHPRMCQCCRCTRQTFKGFSCRSSVCPVVILKGVTLSELYI